MPLPLVIAHHLLSTAYGWWLPNDPRGSCSNCIANDVIAELGELHCGREKVQPTGHEIRGKVFLDTPDDIRRTIKYVPQNPLKLRMPEQHWDFVTPCDGWPLHPGHNPNSPYA